MARISQQRLQEIFQQADATGQNLDRAEIVQELVNRGNEIEGLNEPAPKTLFQKIADRNKAAFSLEQPSAVQRFATGQQGPAATGFQILGQGAGIANDIIGSGLKMAGRGISAITPDAIEKPIVDTVKGAGSAFLQTKVGQAGLQAAQNGMEAYEEWKAQNPSEAANLESFVNIASLVPSGALAKKGQAAAATVSKAVGADDALQSVSQGLRESAEASVSRVLNPTTQGTKATTQKIAGELVDRPLTDTLALTRKGMQAKAGEAAQIAGEAIEGAGTLAGKTNTAEIINFLDSQKQAFMAGGKVVSKEGIESIDEVVRIISQYGDDVDNEVLRTIRKIFDADYYQGSKNIAKSTTETSTLFMKKKAADKIRGILADKFPDVAKLNKEYSFWAGLEDVLSKTVARKTGQKQALKAIATIGGASTGNTVTGKVLNAVGFNVVAGLIDSPAWGFINAKIKNQLSKALADRDLSELGRILGSLPGQAAIQSTSDE